MTYTVAALKNTIQNRFMKAVELLPENTLNPLMYPFDASIDSQNKLKYCNEGLRAFQGFIQKEGYREINAASSDGMGKVMPDQEELLFAELILDLLLGNSSHEIVKRNALISNSFWAAYEIASTEVKSMKNVFYPSHNEKYFKKLVSEKKLSFLGKKQVDARYVSVSALPMCVNYILYPDMPMRKNDSREKAAATILNFGGDFIFNDEDAIGLLKPLFVGKKIRIISVIEPYGDILGDFERISEIKEQFPRIF